MALSTDWKEQVFTELNPSQRIELAMELWDSVPAATNPLPFSDAQISEIRRRVTEADAGRMPSYTWEEVRTSLMNDKP